MKQIYVVLNRKMLTENFVQMITIIMGVVVRVDVVMKVKVVCVVRDAKKNLDVRKRVNVLNLKILKKLKMGVLVQ